jgi:hypothetical protein
MPATIKELVAQLKAVSKTREARNKVARVIISVLLCFVDYGVYILLLTMVSRRICALVNGSDLEEDVSESLVGEDHPRIPVGC